MCLSLLLKEGQKRWHEVQTKATHGYLENAHYKHYMYLKISTFTNLETLLIQLYRLIM